MFIFHCEYKFDLETTLQEVWKSFNFYFPGENTWKPFPEIIISIFYFNSSGKIYIRN